MLVLTSTFNFNLTYFGLNPPVRVCVAPERLGEGRRLVLVCRGQTDCRDKRVLHVQSVSHWAPANIGPYSQGVRTARSLLTAGSIGLLPGSMELATTEAAQAGLQLPAGVTDQDVKQRLDSRQTCGRCVTRRDTLYAHMEAATLSIIQYLKPATYCIS